MTISYHPNIRSMIINRALLTGFSSPSAISIFSGTQPTAAAVLASWATYKGGAGVMLAHYIGAVWSQPSSGALLQIAVPPPVNAIATGTGSWAILWDTNITAVNATNATIPSSTFLVVPVSLNALNGVIKFTDLSFTSGVSKAMFDGSLGCANI